MEQELRIDQLRSHVHALVDKTEITEGVVSIFSFNNTKTNRRQHLWFDYGTQELILTGPAYLRGAELVALDEQSVVRSLQPTLYEYDLIIDDVMNQITSMINNPDDMPLSDVVMNGVIELYKSILENTVSNRRVILHSFPDGEIEMFSKDGMIIVGMYDYHGEPYEAWSYHPTAGFHPDNEINLIHEFLMEAGEVLENFNNIQELVENTLKMTEEEEYEFSLISMREKICDMLGADVTGTVIEATYIDPEEEEFKIFLDIEGEGESKYIKVSLVFEDSAYDEGEEHMFSLNGDTAEQNDETIIKACKQFISHVSEVGDKSSRIA